MAPTVVNWTLRFDRLVAQFFFSFPSLAIGALAFFMPFNSLNLIQTAFAQPVNSSSLRVIPAIGRVVDETATLNRDQTESLERRLKEFEVRKGSQIAVLIVPTTSPETIEQYSLRVANQWKLGRKKVDDGLLLTVAMNDRKLRIEVGYGLEGVVTDTIAKRIIDEVIIPRFKRGSFGGGISEGVDQILQIIDGAPFPPANEAKESIARSSGDGGSVSITSIQPKASLQNATKLGTRVALVIGNSEYKAVPVLLNPRRDAATVAEALRSVGFKSVTLVNDLTRNQLIDALNSFAVESDKADWAVVYYAGHGIEVGGVNYLLPIDAKLAVDRDVQFQAVALEQVMAATEGARKLHLILLDACRENPFANQMKRTVATRSIGRGLGQLEPDSGMLVVYAAKHGEVALDGDGQNSPFVSAFVNRLKTPNIEIRKLFDLVRDDVMATTNRQQQPFSYGSVPGSEDFYFTN